MRLSGSRALLVFQDIQVQTRVLELPALDNWFESVLVWSPRACKSNRRVWLIMYGIPVHAWADRTFENIASLWGTFVRIDGETSDAVSFERARVLIEMDWLCNIDEVIDLEVEGENFEFRVVETDRGAVQFERDDALISESEEEDERQEEDPEVVATSNLALTDGVDGAVVAVLQDGSHGHSRGSMLRLGSDDARVGDQNEAGLELGLCLNVMDKDTEVVQYQGDSRKVRSLSEIMFHCCPPDERFN
ncbi:hypothetical protein V6N11_035488 [Hibiscus sabdariffa]|uniref:DUF4283 domain-containing protein n=1 Tax=Hibiscus sabdariffa TaxID=183260 RepID=A0ABR2R0K4_9ROSI